MAVLQFVSILVALILTRQAIKSQNVFHQNALWFIFILRICFGISVGLTYILYYEGGDTLNFHQDAYTISSFVRDHPEKIVNAYFNTESIPLLNEHLTYNTERPRALLFSKLLSLLHFLTNSSYWINSFLIACLGFNAILFFIKELRKTAAGAVLPAFTALSLYPSTLFWTSGLLKESVMIINMVVCLYCFCKTYRLGKFRPGTVILLAVNLALLLFLKYYILALMLAFLFPAIAIILFEKFSGRRLKSHLLAWSLLVLVFCLAGTLLHPNLSLNAFMNVLVKNHNLMLEASDVNDLMIAYHNLEPSVPSILINTPNAVVSGLFRPFIWESSSVTSLISAVENLLLLTLVLLSVFRIGKKRSSNFGLIHFSILTYVLVSCIFLSISTPNLGTLSRYRVALIPFLIYLLLSNDWIMNKLKPLKNLIMVSSEKEA